MPKFLKVKWHYSAAQAGQPISNEVLCCELNCQCFPVSTILSTCSADLDTASWNSNLWTQLLGYATNSILASINNASCRSPVIIGHPQNWVRPDCQTEPRGHCVSFSKSNDKHRLSFALRLNTYVTLVLNYFHPVRKLSMLPKPYCKPIPSFVKLWH